MGRDENREVRDDVNNARGDVILIHIDIAFWSAHVFRRALEGLDKRPDQVKDGIAPDQNV